MTSRVNIARKLRRNQTDAERKLWFCLKDRRLDNLKFRRQAPVDRYVADFLCADAHLIVELDGGQHDPNSENERARTHQLEAMGYFVLRFWNDDVLNNIDGVLERIIETARPIAPHPNPLPNGERGRTARDRN
jgi:very-short-patch-repair endonuclease